MLSKRSCSTTDHKQPSDTVLVALKNLKSARPGEVPTAGSAVCVCVPKTFFRTVLGKANTFYLLKIETALIFVKMYVLTEIHAVSIYSLNKHALKVNSVMPKA